MPVTNSDWMALSRGGSQSLMLGGSCAMPGNGRSFLAVLCLEWMMELAWLFKRILVGSEYTKRRVCPEQGGSNITIKVVRAIQ